MPSVKKYPKVCAVLRMKGSKEGPLTADDCKKMIGWTEEQNGDDWRSDFVLKVRGNKVRLKNNPTNRPFRLPLAKRYANEHLRGEWRLNLETVVVADNANVLQGQHRLVGLILGELERQLQPGKWGKTPLLYETLVGYGVNTEKNANTYDLGAKRSLDDVIYRHQKFAKGMTDKKQRGISKVLAGAVRLVWLRVGGKQVSFAPHFPHSEALEFLDKHPEILKAVTEVAQLDEGDEGNEKRISSLVSLSYAAGLMYLQTVTSSPEEATKFWTSFATGESLGKRSPILALRQFLTKAGASSGAKRDEIIGTIIKAWLLWKASKGGTTKEIRVKRRKDGDKFILSEFPRIGGLDSEVKVEVGLTELQLLILGALKAAKDEVTYDHLREHTGKQVGTLSTAIMDETKKGKENPHSLISRKLVSVAQYEPEEDGGVSPYHFKLTKDGVAYSP